MESRSERKSALNDWLNIAIKKPFSLVPLAHDASFRRYYRATVAADSFVVMDAPPPVEQTAAFVAITKALRGLGLNSPAVYAADSAQGFLLLSDFGDQTYLKSLTLNNVDALYQRALRALSILQGCTDVPGHPIPKFDAEFMLKEWNWHKEWFANQWLGFSNADLSALDGVYQQIIAVATAQPQVFMHRDYHSANLMVLPDAVGILDFQDAFIGPVTYDAVSLLRDCYIAWPQQKVEDWVAFYWQLLKPQTLQNASLQDFIYWFDWMSVQRHLKALMTFARKAVRDQQPQYLQHVPRTLSYLQQVTSRYTELASLHDYLKMSEQRVMTCAQ